MAFPDCELLATTFLEFFPAATRAGFVASGFRRRDIGLSFAVVGRRVVSKQFGISFCHFCLACLIKGIPPARFLRDIRERPVLLTEAGDLLAARPGFPLVQFLRPDASGIN